MKSDINILVVSHNPFSDTQNNGKTLTSLLGDWPEGRIAQVYFSNLPPDRTVCRKFFRILDADVFKSIFQRRPSCTGSVIDDLTPLEADLSENAGGGSLKNMVLGIFRKRWPIAVTMRNAIWSVGKWNTDGFQQWLDDFQPDLIFFQSSHCTFPYKVVDFIRKRYKIPIIMQTTDDYVSSKFSLDPFFWCNLAGLKKWYAKFARESKAILTIGDKMAEEYAAKFGGNYHVAMNSVDIPAAADAPGAGSDKLSLVYTGNLHSGRFQTLRLLAQTLWRMGGKYQRAHISIYSLVPPTPKELGHISDMQNISYQGALNDPEAVKQVQRDADVLLHVESFRPKDKYITRLSVSTKIPEYMASGACILAVGPMDVASMEYIAKHETGFVIHDVHAPHFDDMIQMLWDNDRREACIEKAYALVQSRHSMEKARAQIKAIACDDSSGNKDEENEYGSTKNKRA